MKTCTVLHTVLLLLFANPYLPIMYTVFSLRVQNVAVVQLTAGNQLLFHQMPDCQKQLLLA
jgi:hypothetical protein